MIWFRFFKKKKKNVGGGDGEVVQRLSAFTGSSESEFGIQQL